MFSLLPDFRSQHQELIGDMKGHDPIGLQVAAIKLERLAGEQVNRDSIAGEGVNHQNVILLWRFIGEREAGVTGHDLHPGGCLTQIGKQIARNGLYCWIDFIKTKDVAFAAISGESAGAKPDNSHTPRPRSAAEIERQANPGIVSIVTCGPHAALRSINLGAVLDGAVIKSAGHPAAMSDSLGHAQGAVEAARLQHGVLPVILDLVMNKVTSSYCGRNPEYE